MLIIITMIFICRYAYLVLGTYLKLISKRYDKPHQLFPRRYFPGVPSFEEMAVQVNWSRQIMILMIAALFAVYWTGKQGLWDAMRGSSPWDKDWTDAKQALVKRVSNK